MLYLVTGPEKSGKSARAEALAVGLGENRIYLATMVPFGEEGRRRVEHHRTLREGKGFTTLECPCGFGSLSLKGRPVVLLECVLNLAANLYFGTSETPPHSGDETVELACGEIGALNERCSHLVVVTGDMAQEDTYDEETKTYIETVSRINERLREAAGQVIESGKQEYPRFPLFVDISGRRVMVAGAGKIGARRAAALAQFGASVLVVAPEGCPDMKRMEQEGLVHWERRHFEEMDLTGAWMAVAATDNSEVNDRIARLSREKGILVSHAGDRDQCDFYFPGIARQGNVVLGVTAGGSDHGLARRMTGELKKWLESFPGKTETGRKEP